MKRVVLIVGALLVGALAMTATVYAQKYQDCAGCLASGVSPWICYMTYGAGCL